MEKQTLIRGAAIVIAGIAASTYAAQNMLSTSPAEKPVSNAGLTDKPDHLLGAGLVASSGKRDIESRTTGAKLSDSPTDLKAGLSAEDYAKDDAKRMAALQDDGLQPEAQAVDESTPQLARAEPGTLDQGMDCTPRLEAAASVDALIELQLNAPCHQSERVVVSHGDLAFSGYTSHEGRFRSYLPAMASDAKIDVFLSDDQFLQAEVAVESVEEHLRFVLQWSGEADFGLHAYHNGAQFGDDGHLHASRPFDPEIDEAFLITLGTANGPEPLRAEVYSIPADQASMARLEIEMRYVSADCGQDKAAYLLQAGPGADAEVKEIVFALPECPAEDGSLVMPIPLDPPRHAALLRGDDANIGQP